MEQFEEKQWNNLRKRVSKSEETMVAYIGKCIHECWCKIWDCPCSSWRSVDLQNDGRMEQRGFRGRGTFPWGGARSDSDHFSQQGHFNNSRTGNQHSYPFFNGPIMPQQPHSQQQSWRQLNWNQNFGSARSSDGAHHFPNIQYPPPPIQQFCHGQPGPQSYGGAGYNRNAMGQTCVFWSKSTSSKIMDKMSQKIE